MIRKYKPFLEEISIKGNTGIPGESNDRNDPKYLSDVERRARARMGDRGRPLPEGDMRLLQQTGMELMGLVNRSLSMTDGKEKELEDLAKRVILDQYESILDGVELDIKLVKMGEPNKMMEEGEKEDDPSYKITNDPDLKKEVDKAKLLNSVIQGEAKNTKNILHTDIVKDGLDSIFGDVQGKEIFDIWNRISKLADKLDWMIPVETRAEMMEEQPMSQAGAVKVEWNKKKADEDKNDLADRILKSLEKGEDLDDNEDDISDLFSDTTPKIKAVGIDFPMLLHETVKGIYELIAAHSIPDDAEFAKKIKLNVTSNADEAEDWRYGPEIASDLRDYINSVIDEMSKSDSKILEISNLREHFFGRMVDRNDMSTDDFLSLFKGILKKDPAVKNRCKSIISDIVKGLRDYDKSQPLPFEMDDVDGGNADSDVMDSDEEDIPIKSPNKKGVDYFDLSKGDLQRAIDDALDTEDYSKVRELTNVLNDKYPEK
jgi:hypothetical protein